MQTLGEMTDRVLRMESQQDTNDTNTRLGVRDALNEAMRIICTTYFWNWMSTEVDIASTSGDTHLSMPADFVALLQLETSDGTILDPRTIERQLEFSTAIAARGLRTYALDGVDANGYMRLRLEPNSTGATYKATYIAIPAEMTDDETNPVRIEYASNAEHEGQA